MGTAIYITCVLAVILLGWPPFLYRRFSRDGYGRPLGRAILWSACLYFLTVLFADLAATSRAGASGAGAFLRDVVGWLVLLLLVAPLPLNLLALIRGVVTEKK